VIGNVLPSPFVNVIVLLDTDAVVNSDPVFVEVDGAQEAEMENDELNTELEPCGPYTFEAVTKLAVCALFAQLAVPLKLPTKEPLNDPVL
jgi:hypothetical protein